MILLFETVPILAETMLKLQKLQKNSNCGKKLQKF